MEKIDSDLRLMRAAQVADALGITVGALAKMRLQGRGPAFCLIGRRVCYEPKEVRAWIDARTFRSTAEATAAAAKDAP